MCNVQYVYRFIHVLHVRILTVYRNPNDKSNLSDDTRLILSTCCKQMSVQETKTHTMGTCTCNVVFNIVMSTLAMSLAINIR